MAVLDLQTIRYINLLDEKSRVKTSKCFMYKGIIIFAVPGFLVSKAIGVNASNVRYIQEKLGKKVKIIKEASGISDAERFIRDIVSPVQFRSLELGDKEIIIMAGSMQNKAMLLGREKKRFEELKEILKNTFGLELRVI